MPAYLLAAEADKIQDILFRSSRLREVVGGSQLLSEFCKQGATLLLDLEDVADKNKDKILINDGGAFRIVFEDTQESLAKSRALKFADALKEFYRRCLGGTISVAKLVEYNESNKELFSKSIKDAQKSLRIAKHQRIAEPSTDAAETVSHLPYAAFCTSCGITLANFDASEKNENNKYMCIYCWHKRDQRNLSKNTIVNDFCKNVRRNLQEEHSNLQKLIRQRMDYKKNQDWAENIGRFDSRNYVAYLIADGNSMGKCFDNCTSKDTLKSLSESMVNIASQSLSLPTAKLFKNQNKVKEKKILPVLPLIVGGDDIFALLPASWALDFASKFCTTWETKMKNLLNSMKLLRDEKDIPTISAAIVICKSNYPYMLAHRFGESLLKEAKTFSRWANFEGKGKVSAICFGLISGNEIGSPKVNGGNYRSTMGVYLAEDNKSLGSNEFSDLLPISKLIHYRRELASLPGKRRNELEELYGDKLPEKSEKNVEENVWNQELENLINRIKKIDSNEGNKLEKALEDLGSTKSSNKGYWKNIGFHHQTFKSNGLSDLLTMWDYTFALDKKQEEYKD